MVPTLPSRDDVRGSPGHAPDDDGTIAAGLEARVAVLEREIASLSGEVAERYEEATFVYRLSERIGSVLGEEAIAGLMIEDVVPVLGAARAEVWLKRGDDLVLAAAHPEAAHRTPPLPVMETVATGRTWTAEEGIGAAAAAAVPLPDGRRGWLGALVLHGRTPGRSYRSGELKLLTAVASLSSAFIRNDRLAAKARLADARRRDDEIASHVHSGLLPRHDPLFAGLEVSGSFRAAERVGGDYYGYVAMSDGSLGLAVADVSGHGIAAALYMATAKGALQSEAREALSPADIVARVNEVLASDFSAADMFATLAFLRFLPDGRRLVWANAGHNPPLLLRGDGTVEELAPSGPAVGIMGGARWRDAETRFAANDILLVYTDGLVEARDADRGFFGVDRLIAAARRPALSAPAIRESVLAALARHTGALPPRDDLTLIVVRGADLPEGA